MRGPVDPLHHCVCILPQGESKTQTKVGTQSGAQSALRELDCPSPGIPMSSDAARSKVIYTLFVYYILT